VINQSLELKAGDIFTWENYPLAMVEQKDRRWFIYLGNPFIEAVVYEITTTTEKQYYQEGGKRHHNNFFTIPTGQGGLVRDSIVDLTMYFEEIPENLFNDNICNIQKQGTLSQDIINILVKHIKEDRNMANIVKKAIYNYLRDAGFTVKIK
jgi:hypothetical protein